MMLDEALDEKELLIRLKDGDHQAFEQLYHRYKRRIAGHLLSLFRDDALAQDIAQDTFIKVWENRARLDEHQSFRAYLFTIATNHAYSLFQRAGKDESARKAFHLALQQASNHVDEYIARKEHAAILASLLDQLPEKQREVFRLAKIEGYSYAEIGERLGISANTINTHLKRAGTHLRALLLDRPDLLLSLLIVQSI